jgi:hypothetical protein
MTLLRFNDEMTSLRFNGGMTKNPRSLQSFRHPRCEAAKSFRHQREKAMTTDLLSHVILSSTPQSGEIISSSE